MVIEVVPKGVRKPSWLKVPLPSGYRYYEVRKILRERRLHTVCEEGNCPNRAECFNRGTATFLIMGRICTRRCLYCNVHSGYPEEIDLGEVERVVQAVRDLDLKYAVITSVTRDDLTDGGASLFATLVKGLRQEFQGMGIEILIPDFGGNLDALEQVIEARPDVINHNIECVSSLFQSLRPQGNYRRSLEVLKRAAEGGIRTKSGLMVGLGENYIEIRNTLQDLLAAHCRWVTIGQYQQPTYKHWPVYKYYTPEEFVHLDKEARALGFEVVVSGPLVRSSYRASLYCGQEGKNYRGGKGE
ncbi:MAG: lipoyl synthase [Syntrophales bacterium]|nr:lipoyl synthase [Syntrophales bacterium]